MNQWAPVPLLPETVDDGGHQAQYTPRVRWNLMQRGPVLVEPVEELGMDGVCLFQAPLVVRVAALLTGNSCCCPW